MVLGEIERDVYQVGVIDWDRRLFDELIPLPDGTSYNAYLIKGSNKVALVDTADPTKEEELITNLEKVGVDKINYVIANHAEQDHSGAIPRVLETYPEAKVVTNKKCRNMLLDLLRLPEERFIEVGDGETLSLGNKTLRFIVAPWVHWPETMFTYLEENRILFTCDFLGCHLATSSLFVEDETEVYQAAKRYYAEIMMPFKTFIRKHLSKIDELNPRIIAPSHGPVYRDPGFILEAYREWVSDTVSNVVVIPYVSMHGSTEKMVNHLIEALIGKGITVKPFNLTKTDIGTLAMSLVDAATVVFASPTVLVGPHPAVLYVAHLVNALKPKLRFLSVVSSYGWGGKTVEQIIGAVSSLKVETLSPVVVRGHPKKGDLEKLDNLADTILEKHKELGIA